ncbi:hemagglutinin repeat-containing protein [Methylophilus sp. 5]|uniref:hemagglutinin repeat-containing protein n=1 Tax=Methylophilus sp. 5 TaxID=1112274 RepID=UPI0004BCDB80|nr:hemagglutinin repeat-containing protein [Methylophilus sp. 5]
MQALAAGTAVLAGKNAYDAVSAGMAKSGANVAQQAGGVNVSLSIGSSKSSSTSTQTSNTAQSSQVTAGQNVNITATGAGEQSDITVIGSQIKAGNDASLKADDQVTLLAAQNTDTLNSKNKGSSASVGVSFGTDGLLFTAGASGSKGKANGTDTTWTETTVEAGNKASIASGTDTTLKGAQVKGKQVIANVGTSGQGNLNVESLQDTSAYKDKQQSVGASASVGYGRWGASANVSDSKTKSNYASVHEQTGIYAGDEGFQVNVNGNTDLKGAIIASTDKAIQDNKNSLTTNTLTTSNIENKAEYDAKGMSISAGVGVIQQANGGGFKASPTASAGSSHLSDDTSSVTVSGISSGQVNITDNAAQQQTTGQDSATTVATLNRDVKVNAEGNAVDSQGNATAGTLKQIFDQDKVQRELNAQVQITQAFSQQAPKAAADYAQSQYDKLKNTDPSEAAKWAEGGIYRIALHTALGGLITGDVSGAAGAGAVASAAPLLNQLQSKVTQSLTQAGASSETASTVSQAVAQLTSMGIGSAIGGVAGAGAALVVDTNNRQLHWSNYLNEKQSCNKNPSAQGCSTILAMSGTSSRPLDSSISGISDQMVIGNFDAQGNLVSYTIADNSGQPKFIMQPLEFEVYRNTTPGIRAMMETSPQWALDYASTVIYQAAGQTDKAIDHAATTLTNKQMWVENAVGLLGGVLAGAEIRAAQTIKQVEALGIPDNINVSAQSRHISLIDGRSSLIANPNELLAGIHSGAYTIVRQNRPGTVLIDFGKTIGNFSDNGVLVGPSQYGWVSYGKNGVHIYPANPVQR